MVSAWSTALFASVFFFFNDTATTEIYTLSLHDAHPIPGVPELLQRRTALGDVIVYATNNSSRHRSDYEAILTAIGAPVSAERIVTSARATALFLRERTPPVRVALVLGGPGLRRELRDAGIRVVAPTPVGV